MSLNRTSLDTEVLILRRMYAMSTANIPVSTNYILGAGTAGQVYFQNTLQNISTYGIDLSNTISTIYGQIAAVSLSGGVSYPYFISTISGLYEYINSQDSNLSTSFSLAISQINSTISGLTISGSVSETQFTSTVSGIYGYISTISTNQGATISTNYTTLSGGISSINGYNSAYSTNIGGLISSFDTRISSNTTNISTVNNYLDQRISSLSSAQISSYFALSTLIYNTAISSSAQELSTFSTTITLQLLSTSSGLTTQINDVSSSLLAVSSQVAYNTYDIGQVSSLVSTNYGLNNISIISTGQGVYYNPYFKANTTISGSLSMVTGGIIDASGSSTFTKTLYVSHRSSDLSNISLFVNYDSSKSYGNFTNTSRAVIYDLAQYPSTNRGTLALYDINNATISSNTGPSIIFGGLYTDDKLWYRAKISAVASPSADPSGSVIGGGDIVFTTKDNNNTYTMTDKMRIMHNGNVIIGPQLSTTQKLYVHGSATIASTIFTSTASATSIVANTIQTSIISCNTIIGSPTISGILTIQNGGTAVTPSLIFGSPLDGGLLDDNTGIYHPEANSIAIACNGTPHIICSTNAVIMNVNTYNASSATIAGNLTICGSTTTARSIVASTIQTGILTVQNGGTSVTPSIIFGSPLDGGFLDDNTGIYHPAANSIAISCNGFPHIICSTNTVIMNVNTYNALSATIAGNLTICGITTTNILQANAISTNTIVNNSTITYTRSGIQYPLSPVIIEIKPATSLIPKVSTFTDIPSLSYTIPVSGYYQYTVHITFIGNLSTPVYGDGIMTSFNISGLGVYLPGGYNTSSVLKGYDNLGQIVYTATIGYRFTAGQNLRISHAEIGTFTYTSASISVTYVLVGE